MADHMDRAHASADLAGSPNQEDRQEGEAAVLLRLLTHRFGPLGVPLTEQIRQASLPELEQWANNIRDARSLDEVFQPR